MIHLCIVSAIGHWTMRNACSVLSCNLVIFFFSYFRCHCCFFFFYSVLFRVHGPDSRESGTLSVLATDPIAILSESALKTSEFHSLRSQKKRCLTAYSSFSSLSTWYYDHDDVVQMNINSFWHICFVFSASSLFIGCPSFCNAYRKRSAYIVIPETKFRMITLIAGDIPKIWYDIHAYLIVFQASK